jgi:hypothetical protein
MKAHRPTFQRALIVVALAAAYPLHGHAAAGVAQFIAGDVSVRRGAGSDKLAKGSAIESGDDIVTGSAGQAQIRFSDGGLVSLQPNTQFKIDRYADANDPKQDGFLVNFVRGGMRAITGLIGKRNRENYKVQTATATIGIRGSAFNASYNTDGSLNVGTEKDEIEVCTNAGCVGLKFGESARVGGNNQLPTRTNVVTTFPSIPSPQPVEFVAGSGAGFTGSTTDLSFGSVYHYSYDGSNWSETTKYPYAPSFYDTPPVTTFKSGLVTGFTGVAYDYAESFVATPGTPSSFGNVGAVTDANYVGWGYWAAGTVDWGGSIYQVKDLHYIVGRQTDSALLPQTGIGEYALIGGTAPTSSYGTGSLVSGNFTAYFGSGFSVNLTTQFGGTQYNVSANGSLYGSSQFSGSSSSYSGSSYVQGMFIGPNADRVGLTYKQTGTPIGTISGAAAFQQTSYSAGSPQ